MNAQENETQNTPVSPPPPPEPLEQGPTAERVREQRARATLQALDRLIQDLVLDRDLPVFYFRTAWQDCDNIDITWRQTLEWRRRWMQQAAEPWSYPRPMPAQPADIHDLTRIMFRVKQRLQDAGADQRPHRLALARMRHRLTELHELGASVKALAGAAGASQEYIHTAMQTPPAPEHPERERWLRNRNSDRNCPWEIVNRLDRAYPEFPHREIAPHRLEPAPESPMDELARRLNPGDSASKAKNRPRPPRKAAPTARPGPGRPRREEPPPPLTEGNSDGPNRPCPACGNVNRIMRPLRSNSRQYRLDCNLCGHRATLSLLKSETRRAAAPRS